MAASSPRNDLVKNCRVHPTHWLISTQVPKLKAALKKEKVTDLTGKKADLKARLLEKLGL